jgi:ribonuclease E
MNIPEGIGYIIRTEAVGRTPEELKKDLDNLLELYEGIKQQAAEIKGAGEVYRDRGLIIRTIRDYFSDDIDEVLVDSKDAYREAKEFFRETMPKCEKLVKLHKEKRPIFSRFQLEEQIDQIYEKRVPLPSGGSLIIEPTEALVSIDVNSGKSSGERGIEDTAFKTNMEAAEEVARQLRLRDLGGLIVIDFIDMRDRKHNSEVEKVLKNALKMDKARVNLGRISEFGILEMSRQRIAKTLNDAIHLSCPHCEGRGKVKSVEAMALSFLRKVHAAAAKGTVAEVRGGLPLEVAYYLLNRKKRELTQIENDYDIEVTVKGKTSFLLNQLELEIVKRDKPHMEDVLKSEAEADEAPKAVTPKTAAAAPVSVAEHAAEEGATAEGGKKRKRRRKKKKHAGEVAHETGQIEAPPSEEHPEPATDEGPVSAPAETGEETEEAAAKHKKRRRRRGRKGGKGADAGTIEAETSTESPEPEHAPVVEPAPQPEQKQAEEPADAKPKRARASRAKKKSEPLPPESAPAPIESAAETPAPVAPKKPRRSVAKKVAEPAPLLVEPAAEPAKKAARPRRKKTESAPE